MIMFLIYIDKKSREGKHYPQRPMTVIKSHSLTQYADVDHQGLIMTVIKNALNSMKYALTAKDCR